MWTNLIKYLNRRNSKYVGDITQALINANKKASGKLAQDTKGFIRVDIGTIAYQMTAPKHWVYIDKGVKGRKSSNLSPGSPFKYKKKFANLSAIDKWLKIKGIDANKYAVARSIANKGIAATHIYSRGYKNIIDDLRIGFNTPMLQDIQKELKGQLHKIPKHIQ